MNFRHSSNKICICVCFMIYNHLLLLFCQHHVFDIWCISNWNWKHDTIASRNMEFRIHITNLCLCLLALLCQWIILFAEKVSGFKIFGILCKMWNLFITRIFGAFIASCIDRMFQLKFILFTKHTKLCLWDMWL